jgi:serine protease Do
MRVQSLPRKIPYVALCGVAVFLGWLAIRLWGTYLPAQADDLAAFGNVDAGRIVAADPRDAGDLPRLEERVREAARAVLPSVVAVRNPEAESSGAGGYRGEYASGVIITADGLVLSQWHVSHRKIAGGDGATIREDSPTCSAGDRTTVILHDGRECPAELLGADRTRDLSLLRLLEPGTYPHAPIRATAPVIVGDWVLKVGHPFGYREGRSAPVRLGRIICGTEEVFGTDCPWSGGDSGGPYFSLDGQLLGIIHSSDAALAVLPVIRADPDLARRAGGWSLASASGAKLIDPLMGAMLRGEVSPRDEQEAARIGRELAAGPLLRAEDYSQGRSSLARYRPIVGPTRPSVVVVLNAGVAVALGTVVGPEGWVLTKASEIPGRPTCRLPDGRVVPARVVGVDPAFDLALLSVPATDLEPVRWAADFDPPVGTLLAAVGTGELPLAVGIVSVPRRDLDAPVRTADALPLRMSAGRPEIFGYARPIGGYSPHAAFGRPRPTIYHVTSVSGLAWSAGVRPGDLLHRIDGRRIQSEGDLLEAVEHRPTGDVVPVRLERAGKMMDLQLPLAPETRHTENSFRADDFPTVIECAVPFFSYECGGPVVDLSGRAIGISIARPGPHGGMVIPGDRVLRLLPDLKAGRPAGNWATESAVDQ